MCSIHLIRCRPCSFFRTSLAVAILVFLLFFGTTVEVEGLDLDYGGIIENDTNLNWIPDFGLTQRDALSLWFSTGIGEMISLAAQGSYTYTNLVPYMFDLDYLELTGAFPSVAGEQSLFTVSAGRFFYSEPSGVIFAHMIDGLALDFSWPALTLSLAAGYTGFLLKPTSGIALSNYDLVDRADAAISLAPRRLIESASISLPELFLRQTVDISVLLQQDLRPLEGLVSAGEQTELFDSGGRFDTQYYSVGISGPLAGILYYQTLFALQTGSSLTYQPDAASPMGGSYQASSTLAGYGRLRIELYLANLLSSRIVTEVRVASGDADFAQFTEGNTAGKANVFTPVTDLPSSLIFSPQTGNISSIQLSYSLLPFEWVKAAFGRRFQASVDSAVFLRTVTGPISAGGTNAASEAQYLGTEVDLTLNFRLFSDLGLSLSGGMFLPNNTAGSGALLPENWSNSYTARLRVFFAF